MRLKARAVLTALLALAVAAPVIATIDRYTDVPDDHEFAEAIEWASDPENFSGAQLFKGYNDGSFKPDKDLTENQLRTVVKRLFDTQDSWTRAETAAFLHAGWKALWGDTATSAQTECAWPLENPRWIDKQAGTFRFSVLAACSNSFEIILHLPGGNFQSVRVPASQSVTQPLDWPTGESSLTLQVNEGGASRTFDYGIITTTTTTTAPPAPPPVASTRPPPPTFSTQPTTPPRPEPPPPPPCQVPLIYPRWENHLKHDFRYRVDNIYKQGFYLYFINQVSYISRDDTSTRPLVWSRGRSSETVRVVFDNGCAASQVQTYGNILPAVPATTTTTQPQTNLPQVKTDRQLKVGFNLDDSDNFNMKWVRAGWESVGWKWRLHSYDRRCGHTNGVGDWDTSRVGKGYRNGIHLFEGLCVRTQPWQIEIVWDNGARFVSRVCSLSRNPARSGGIWNCPLPFNWSSRTAWPNYHDIPPTLSLTGTEFHSDAGGITSFDVVINISRDYYFYMAVCGKKWGQRLAQGTNKIRVHCPTGENTRVELIKSRVDGARWLNEVIAVPTGTKELGAATLTPEVRVTSTSPEGTARENSQFKVEVIVGNSETAQNSTATLYRNRDGWGRDHDGNPTRLLRQLTFSTDRFLTESGNRIGYAPVFYIQVNEPGAPTHHLTYTFPTVEGG